MTKSTLKLALAVVGAALVTTTTFSATASAKTVQLRTADIDFNAPGAQAQLAKRIHAAARQYCAGQVDTGSNLPSRGCISGVEQELSEKVAARTTSVRMAANH